MVRVACLQLENDSLTFVRYSTSWIILVYYFKEDMESIPSSIKILNDDILICINLLAAVIHSRNFFSHVSAYPV